MSITDHEPTGVRMPGPVVRERAATAAPGAIGPAAGLLLLAGAVWAGFAVPDEGAGIALAVPVALLGALVLRGLITVRPAGLHRVNPFSSRRKISTPRGNRHSRNHESDVLKVNDNDGNPIGIVAFVHTRTETATRHNATSSPLRRPRRRPDVVARQRRRGATERLSAEIALRAEPAGVHIVESRLTPLTYAPGIAGATLQRQQAGAAVAARSRIVEGAVGMVEMAPDRLSEREIVDLDEEREAAMVSNLLVVLCGDRATQPIINAGSLY